MPYPYGYFKPTGKEQLGMLGGSALVGLLSALQPRQPGDASPILKGIEGATAGYGGGYKAYQDMMGDAWGRNLNEQKFGQDVNQFDQQMGLNREKFGEEKRQYEESEKPTRQAQTGWYDAMSRNTDFDNQMAFDKMIQGRLNAEKDNRFNTKMNQLEMRKKKNEVVNSRLGKRDSEGRPWYQYTRDLETPEGTMAEVFDARKGTFGLSKPAGIGKPKIDPTLPASEASDLGTLKELQGTVGNIKKILLDDKGNLMRGDLLGPIEGRTQEQLSKLISNPDFIKLKHNTVQLRQVVYGLSGKAINENELKWLNEKILPSIENQDDNYLVNLNEFNDWLGRKSQTQTEAFGKAGYRNMDKFKEGASAGQPQSTTQTVPKESALQELFDLAQKGDPEALQYFRSKGIK